jgi:hypothetical protein
MYKSKKLNTIIKFFYMEYFYRPIFLRLYFLRYEYYHRIKSFINNQ